MKYVYKIGVTIVQIGFAFWLIETIVFLILEGWHYKATNPKEVLCDAIAILVIRIGLFLWFVYAAWIINLIHNGLNDPD